MLLKMYLLEQFKNLKSTFKKHKSNWGDTQAANEGRL